MRPLPLILILALAGCGSSSDPTRPPAKWDTKAMGETFEDALKRGHIVKVDLVTADGRAVSYRTYGVLKWEGEAVFNDIDDGFQERRIRYTDLKETPIKAP